MTEAFYIAATGMAAHQKTIDTIANNMSNLRTTAFKRSKVNFDDLVARTFQPAETIETALNMGQPMAMSKSQGVGIREIALQFESGELVQTGDAMDVAIQGDGFIEVTLPEGGVGYVRGGHLKIDQDGFLATQGGLVLKPGLRVPQSAQQILISGTGLVSYTTPERDKPVEAGQLELVRFTNASGLNTMGSGLYKVTEASGQAIAVRPQDHQSVHLMQGTLENSNVKLVDEMVALTLSQRAFEANSKVIQASDQILEMINNLRK